MASKSKILFSPTGLVPPLRHSQNAREVQPLPDYTSPPLEDAMEATPEAFRRDEAIDCLRAAHFDGNCSPDNNTLCQIPFAPPSSFFSEKSSDSLVVGVILYGGALVDPRGYSVLANRLANVYGLPTVIPVFYRDLAFTAGNCNEDERLASAQAQFPSVKKWIFVGHSFGGIAAMTDVWEESKHATDFARIGGLVMMASYIRQDVGCGAIDFSLTSLPAATITATLDGVLNRTRWERNLRFLPPNTTMVTIEGGTHGQFGSYDDTLRKDLFCQNDGNATIAPEEQWEIVVQTIYDVAQRTGLDLPRPSSRTGLPTVSPANTVGHPTEHNNNTVISIWLFWILLACIGLIKTILPEAAQSSRGYTMLR